MLKKISVMVITMLTALTLLAAKVDAAGNYVICRVDWLSEDSARIQLQWKEPSNQTLMITSWQADGSGKLRIYYQTGQAAGYDSREIKVEKKVFPCQVELIYSAAPQSEQKPVFTDMTGAKEKDEAILNLYYQGILGGYPDGSFGPDKGVNRAEFAKILCEALKMPQKQAAGSVVFQDIDNSWAKGYIWALAEKKLINGKAEKVFDPNGSVTLGEVLTLLDRSFYLYHRPETLTETLPQHWSNSAYLTMKAQAVVKPGDDIYAAYTPNRPATRMEVALFLSRVLEQKHDAK
jgi:cellulosome-anchoring protein